MGVNVDGRRCRERIKLLVSNRKTCVRSYEATGRVEEEPSPIDLLLDEVIALQQAGRRGVIDRRQERVELEEAKEEREEEDEFIIPPAEQVARPEIDEAMPVVLEEARPVEKRKALDDSALLAYFHARLEADTHIKRLKLDLEARRLQLEEKRQEMAERKMELESQERVAMINLLAGMSAKLFGAPTNKE